MRITVVTALKNPPLPAIGGDLAGKFSQYNEQRGWNPVLIIRQIYKFTSYSLNIAASLLVAAMMFVVTAGVVARFVFNRPFAGAYELVATGMGALAGLGLAFALDHRIHVRLTLLTDHFGSIGKHYALLISYIVLAIFAGLWAWNVISDAITSTLRLEYDLNTGIPIYPARLVFAFALVLLVFSAVLKVAEGVKRLLSGQAKGGEEW